MPPAPVSSTQRSSIPRSSEGIASAIPLSISWSRAFRESGLLRVRRATASAGWSRSSLPPANSGIAAGSLFEDDEDVALGDRLALLDPDLGDLAGVLRLDRHLHLHRLQDDDRVPLVDLVTDGDFNLPDCACDVGFYIRHARRGQYPAVTRQSSPRVAILAARNEGDRIGAALDALREALPGARLIVADDASTDGTQLKAM